ncbi:gamma-mobile-trio protein GmtX [Paraglaciecola mesophila]|uniref:Gamma-mobile-trio protein GmtX n=1 Tax=Paraglaciecola mesophila TaxID=197222 RepID=A0ABU9SW63_9ALTE
MEKQQVTQLYGLLVEENKGKQSKLMKLNAIHKICEGLAGKGLPIEIANVVKHLALNGTQISKQSIYNKQGDANPYRKLVDAWAKYSVYEKQKKSPQTINVATESFLTTQDLAEIKNPVLKYKLSMLYSEVTALRSQNNMLRDIRTLHAIQTVPVAEIEVTDGHKFILDEYEIEILESFKNLDGTLSFNEDGRLFAKTSIPRGTLLSTDGLKDVIQKVLKSYGKDING